MITQQTVTGDEWQVTPGNRQFCAVTRHPSRATRHAFSLVEVLVVVSLLSVIVLALMAVFSSTQRAFRASVTQTDVLEGGRMAVDLMATDLRQMTPSGGVSNGPGGPVNFFVADNNYFPSPSRAYSPLLQSLPGISSPTIQRKNLLNYFFLLGRENTRWIGIGYVVNPTNTMLTYPLYRYYAETNLSASPLALANNFWTLVNNGQWTNLSHVMDGVVHLTVQACDVSGYPMTNTYQFYAGRWVTNKNVQFYPATTGEVGASFYSNTIPASVELELGVLEDRVLQRAESLPHNSPAQLNFLSQQAGKVHIFRQRVTIPNVDLSAYQ